MNEKAASFMKLSNLVKDFVSKKENTNVLIELTKLSTDYFSSFIFNNNYSNPLKGIRNYLAEHEEFKGVDAGEFSVELIKYLYEERKREKIKMMQN
jgi:hypothetical protein